MYIMAPLSPYADWVVNSDGTITDLVAGATPTFARTGIKTIDNLNGTITDVLANKLAVKPRLDGKPGFGAFLEDGTTNAFIRSYFTQLSDVQTWTMDATGTAVLGSYHIYQNSQGAALSAGVANVAFWRTFTATAALNSISCYVYTGSAVTSADMQLCSLVGSLTPVASLLTTTFTAVGGNWYRATATFTGTAATWTGGVCVKAGKSVTVDALQVTTNLSGVLQSYIPTTTGTVVRNMDSLSVPSSGWSLSALTIFMVCSDSTGGAAERVIDWAGDASNSVVLTNPVSNAWGANTVMANAVSYSPSTNSTTAGAYDVLTISYANGAKVIQYVNGTKGNSSASNMAANLANMSAAAYVGNRSSGSRAHNAEISRVVIYNSQLSDANVTTVSTFLANGNVSAGGAGLLMMGVQ